MLVGLVLIVAAPWLRSLACASLGPGTWLGRVEVGQGGIGWLSAPVEAANEGGCTSPRRFSRLGTSTDIYSRKELENCFIGRWLVLPWLLLASAPGNCLD